MSRGCRPEPVPAKAGAGMTGWYRRRVDHSEAWYYTKSRKD